MEFYELKYFSAIWENRSFSKAAAIMHISQPALSQCVQKLEMEIGVPLLNRSTRHLMLTEAGELVLDYGKRILDMKQNLDGAIKEIIHSDEVEIKVGISPFYSKHYLPSALKIIKERFPNINLKIIEDISYNLERLIADRSLDFCCIPQDPEIEGLSYEPICMEEILLAVPQSSPLREKAIPASPIPFLDIKWINNQRLVTLKQIQKINQLLKPLFEAGNLRFHIVYETLDWDTVNIMIANGLGIGFVPDILTASDLGSMTPLYYRIANNGFLRRYSIAYKTEKTFTPLERHLIDIFRIAIQETRSKKIYPRQ